VFRDLDVEWGAEDFLDEAFPDGLGNGYGGAYSQDDMEDAFAAGYEFGKADA
jgi:hypothetical protein